MFQALIMASLSAVFFPKSKSFIGLTSDGLHLTFGKRGNYHNFGVEDLENEQDHRN